MTNKEFSLKLFLFLLASFLLGASFYFQFVKHLEPCPLCITQRVALFGLVLVYFWSFFIRTKKLDIWNNGLQLFFALFGALMSTRHIWLIHFPPKEQTGCMPDINTLWHYLPFQDILFVFLNGTGDCTKITWTFLRLNMPEWTLGFFVFFWLIAVFRFWKKPKN